MSTVRVRMQTGRLRLVFEGREAAFERMAQPLLVLAARGTGSASPPGATPATVLPAGPAETAGAAAETATGYRPPSRRFGTFTRQLDPEKNGGANRIAAFAFFLWNYERKEVVHEDEIAGCCVAQGSALPEDPQPLYESLVQQRVLTPGEAAKTWRLTPKGRAHVRHHLLSS